MEVQRQAIEPIRQPKSMFNSIETESMMMR